MSKRRGYGYVAPPKGRAQDKERADAAQRAAADADDPLPMVPQPTSEVHDSALTLAGVMIVQAKQPVQADAFGKDRFGS